MLNTARNFINAITGATAPPPPPPRPSASDNNMQTKLVALGDCGVGKTCLLRSFALNTVPATYVPTVLDNYSISMMVDRLVVNLSLWDTAGDGPAASPGMDRLRPLSFPGTHVFLVCYSISDLGSFESVRRKWVPEIRARAPGAVVVLCATKADLRSTSASGTRACAKGHRDRGGRGFTFHARAVL